MDVSRRLTPMASNCFRWCKICDSPVQYEWFHLRTVPAFVPVHTFCTPRDTRVSYMYGWLLIQGYFCAVENYAWKAELSKCSWYPKRKLGVTMDFLEITKLQRHTFRWNNCFLIISKTVPLPPVFFLDSSSPYRDLLFPHSHKLW